MSLSFYGKRPGPGMRLDKLSLQFAMHDTGLIGDVLEAYERLILDAMRGDHTLFNTAEGIERLWQVSIPLLEAPPPVRLYPRAHGARSIHQLIAPHAWRLPFERACESRIWGGSPWRIATGAHFGAATWLASGRVLPRMRCPAHGADGGAPRGPRIPHVPVRRGYSLYRSAAPAAGFATQAGNAGAAGGAPRGHTPSAHQAGLKPDEADSGAVTLIQRFGSAANLNIHLRCMVLYGVYQRGADGTPEFVEAHAPTDEALQSVVHKIIIRTMKLPTRRGVLIEAEDSTYMADNDGDSDEARVLRPLPGAMPRETDFKQALRAVIDGFSLHAAVRGADEDRQARRHHAPGHVAVGVHATAGGTGATATFTPHTFPWRAGT
jgi:hypothetical protein